MIIRSPVMSTRIRSLRSPSVLGVDSTAAAAVAHLDASIGASSAAAVPAMAPVAPAEAGLNLVLEEAQRYQAELAAAKADADQRGYSEGLARGEAAGRDQWDAACAELVQAARDVSAVIHEAQDVVQQHAVEIAFAIVCKILGKAATTRKGVAAHVSSVLRPLERESVVRLRVAPSQVGLYRAALDEVLEETHAIDVVGDAGVSGGCIVDCADQSLDARLEVQLGQFKDALVLAAAKPVRSTVAIDRPAGSGAPTDASASA